MSILNPWGEAKALRKQVAKLGVALLNEQITNCELRGTISTLRTDIQPRDPKTGRMLPKAK